MINVAARVALPDAACVVGPPPTNGRGVFVVFLSFCIGFYSILSVSRCATGPFFYLVFSFVVFFYCGGGFWGGLGGGRGGVITSRRVRFT